MPIFHGSWWQYFWCAHGWSVRTQRLIPPVDTGCIGFYLWVYQLVTRAGPTKTATCYVLYMFYKGIAYRRIQRNTRVSFLLYPF